MKQHRRNQLVAMKELASVQDVTHLEANRMLLHYGAYATTFNNIFQQTICGYSITCLPQLINVSLCMLSLKTTQRSKPGSSSSGIAAKKVDWWEFFPKNDKGAAHLLF